VLGSTAPHTAERVLLQAAMKGCQPDPGNQGLHQAQGTRCGAAASPAAGVPPGVRAGAATQESQLQAAAAASRPG